MWKYVAVVLILVLATTSVILGVRLQSQTEEYAAARARVAYLMDDHEVLRAVVDESGLRRDSVVSILEKRFPNEEIRHQAESIRIKNTELLFLGDGDVTHIHSPFRFWSCGPVFGCTPTWESLPYTPIDRVQDASAHLFASYGMIFLLIAFAGAVVYMARRWSSLERNQRVRLGFTLAFGVFLLGLATMIGMAKISVDAMLENGASSVLVAAGWKIAGQYGLIGVVTATILAIAPWIADRIPR